VAVAAGFEGLTVGSHPAAESIGRADGEQMAFSELTDRVAQITGRSTSRSRWTSSPATDSTPRR
jgi:2-methylisocitrate lyase-like PEP mutase family enzyme